VNSVTLGITYYNEKELLTQCLASLFECRSLPDEVLIYDDCSQYPAADYLVRHDRCHVRVIRGEQNIMLAAARNAILYHGKCDYIHYQDADDLFDPKVFSDLIDHTRQTSADLVINDVRSVRFESGALISPSCIGLSAVGGDRRDLISHAILGSFLAPTLTFRKALGLKLGGYDHQRLKQCEDYDFAVRMLMTVEHYELFPAAAVVQRVRAGSMSSRKAELYENAYLAINGLAEQFPCFREVLGVRALRIAQQCNDAGFRHLTNLGVRLARSLSDEPYARETRKFRMVARVFGIPAAVRVRSVIARLRRAITDRKSESTS